MLKSSCLDRLEEYLYHHHVPYEVQHHHRAVRAHIAAMADHIPAEMFAKVVMVRADGKLAMLVVPANRDIDLEKATHMLQAKRVELAFEDDFAKKFPDCEIGAMPPFGNLYQFPVYVDKVLTRNEAIFFHAGDHTITMSLKFADFNRLVQPVVAEFATYMEVAV